MRERNEREKHQIHKRIQGEIRWYVFLKLGAGRQHGFTISHHLYKHIYAYNIVTFHRKYIHTLAARKLFAYLKMEWMVCDARDANIQRPLANKQEKWSERERERVNGLEIDKKSIAIFFECSRSVRFKATLLYVYRIYCVYMLLYLCYLLLCVSTQKYFELENESTIRNSTK